jgi:SAM-dependent methyltransferase
MAMLQVLRQAFGSTSETPLLIEIIREHFVRRAHITMLDVGIGDGASARKVMTGLRRHGVRVSLTGVDPHIPASAYRLRWPCKPHLVALHLASYRQEKTYDVVNATQSLYYLGDECEALKRLVSLVSPGGILTITIWADGCTLKRVHDVYLAPGYYSPCVDEVSRALQDALPPGYGVKTYRFDGTILLGAPGRVRQSTSGALLGIAERGTAAPERARHLALEYLDSLGKRAPRCNVIVAAVPSPAA